MMKTIIAVFTCATLVAITFATSETPVECKFGTPEYNDALCNETCAKEDHMSQPYCSNFTQPVTPQPSTSSTPSTPTIKHVEEKAKEVTKTLEQPVIEGTDPKSQAPSLRSSLFFCASYLLLSFI